MASKRNCVKSFEITQNHPRWSMSEWQCDSLNHDIHAMMPWHLCDVAHNELLQVAELVEKTWQEVDRGTTLRQSHTMLEHWSDLVLTKKMVPPYKYSTRLDLANSCIFEETWIRREEVLMGGKKAPGPSWTSWSPTHWHEADTNTGILKSKWWFSM